MINISNRIKPLIEERVRDATRKLIAEFLTDLKRLPDSKESFRLIEKWEGRQK